MSLTPEEEQIRDDILAAPDMQIATQTEPITEPVGASKGLTRVTREDHTSATVQVGKTYRRSPIYINGPDSEAWGAMSGIDEDVV